MSGRKGKAPTSPYDALAREVPDEHPVDLLISRRLPQEQLRRRMRKASDRLTRLLGDRRQEWLAVEELWNDYRLNREKAYFDLGHEQGVRLGRAEALRGGPSGEEIQPLVGRICQLVDEADLTSSARLVALIKATWAFAVTGTQRGSPSSRLPASQPDSK